MSRRSVRSVRSVHSSPVAVKGPGLDPCFRATVTALALVLPGVPCSTAASAEDLVTVSVKHILDFSGHRSVGVYSADSDIARAIREANSGLENSVASSRSREVLFWS